MDKIVRKRSLDVNIEEDIRKASEIEDYEENMLMQYKN